MKIRKLVLGQLGTNAYLLGEKRVALVDPAANAKGIVDFLEKEGLVLDKILVTHGHFDHVCALKALKDITGAKVYMHKDDISMLGSMEKSFGFMTGETPEKCEIDFVLEGGEEIELDGGKVTVMHTPGHSQGSVSYIGEGFVCAGDLIFRESIGRYDLGGDYAIEMASIGKLFDAIENDWTILPGHGAETTKEHEEKHNPYLG
ncbi:MAG: MBL fold metallo-hydrolase [Clostridia bacterium]|nr:MBL fold metallo-hydrolase [Clostridia bacterium]